MIKYRFLYDVHPLKNDAWLEEQKKRNTEDELAREVLISYDYSVAGIVFKEFTSAHVVKGEYQFDPYLPTIVGFDFGRTCSALFAQKTTHGCLRVFKEIVLTGAGTQDLGKFVQNYLSELNSKSQYEYCCDPAGNSPDHRTKTTDIQILEDMGMKPIRFDKAIKMKDRLKDGVSLTRKKLSERIQGTETIQVWEEGCPILIDAFRSGYRYKQDASGKLSDSVIQEEHPYEDVMDCLRYILIEKFTVSSGQPQRKGMIVTDMKFGI